MKISRKNKQFITTLLVVFFILTGCGHLGQPDEQNSTTSIVTFQMVPSSNGVNDLLKNFDHYSKENEGLYYNVIPEDISAEYGFSVFKSDLTCYSILVYEDELYPLGEWFGGYGVTSFAIADLNGDDAFELYYTCSWGSGIHRSMTGYFDTASKESVTFDYANFKGESLLGVDRNQNLCVYNADWDVKSFVDIELTAGDKIASVVVDDGEITLVPDDPSYIPMPGGPAEDTTAQAASEAAGSASGASASESKTASGASASESSAASESKTESEPSAGISSGTPSAGQTSGPAGAFTALHGALSVNGTDLVDQNGDPIRLYGMSTHGIAWFPQYVNYDTFRTLRDDWNTNCVRLALYTDEYNGYSNGGSQEELKTLIKNGIDYATDLGMYVIVDWHILHDQDPNVHKEDAISFFREISSLYRDHTNILYEICNEPNGYATWDSVKSYANEVIPVIRENDGDAVILVGSPTWSQNIDQAAASPLEFDNVMYTLHFYAATHTDDLRSRLETCVNNGLPVFVSEFGMCDASGNGGNNFDQAGKWMELLDKYNISFFCWNLANKAETCSVLKSSCEKTADWTEDDLSESGRWIRERFRNASNASL